MFKIGTPVIRTIALFGILVFSIHSNAQSPKYELKNFVTMLRVQDFGSSVRPTSVAIKNSVGKLRTTNGKVWVSYRGERPRLDANAADAAEFHPKNRLRTQELHAVTDALRSR